MSIFIIFIRFITAKIKSKKNSETVDIGKFYKESVFTEKLAT